MRSTHKTSDDNETKTPVYRSQGEPKKAHVLMLFGLMAVSLTGLALTMYQDSRPKL